MPIGFNLFSFDVFEAFRSSKQNIDFAPAIDASAPAADDDSDERDHEREADIAFWGLAYYPVM